MRVINKNLADTRKMTMKTFGTWASDRRGRHGCISFSLKTLWNTGDTSRCVRSILVGLDCSHWFDPRTKQSRAYTVAQALWRNGNTLRRKKSPIEDFTQRTHSTQSRGCSYRNVVDTRTLLGDTMAKAVLHKSKTDTSQYSSTSNKPSYLSDFSHSDRLTD